MTTQVLDYLDKVVEQAVQREIDPHVETPSLRKVLEDVRFASGSFGFTMPREVVVASVTEKHNVQRRQQINQYRDDAMKMRAKLQRIGVEPLAVITKSAWHKILEESKLFVVCASQTGGVHIGNELVKQFRDQAQPTKWAHRALIACVFAAGAVGSYLTGYLTQSFDWTTASWIATYSVAGGVSVIVAMMTVIALGNRREDRRYKRLVNDFLRTHSWDEVLTSLTGEERVFLRTDDFGVNATVILPEPPLEVARIICKLPELNGGIRIAAEAGAISFKGGIAKVLIDARDEMIRQEETLHYDPIVYIEEYHNSAVAIVAQFGDFPIEKETIDRVVNSEHLL